MSRRRIAILAVAALAALGAAAGCSTIGYYSQAIFGHLDVIRRASPVAGYLDDPATDPKLRARLALATAIRDFASRALALPDNRSYRKYADLGRPFALWNVIAAGEFSVKPEQSCFPVTGCVNYRGFYAEADAERYGADERAAGLDVFVYGVPAYSTLGWFDDPLLNTFIYFPEVELARLIFHELAHQVVYIRDDTEFNESFAVAVEEAGVERWLAAHGTPADRTTYRTLKSHRAEFTALALEYRERLETLYARTDLDVTAKRAAKAAEFAAMRADYEKLKAAWGGWPGYDRWFARGLNNAHLASVATYTRLVPAFAALLAREKGDLAAFYRAVEALGRLPRAERDARLAALTGGSG